ncbi:MAG: zinc-ribbon domain-containing protein, partial [Candidatus Hodarchaeota archaeon]
MSVKSAKYCHNCGNAVIPGSMYCEACGSRLADSPATQTMNTNIRFQKNVGGDYRGYITLIGILDILFSLPALLAGILLVLIDIIAVGLVASGRVSTEFIINNSNVPNVSFLYGIAVILFIVGIGCFIYGIIRIVIGMKLMQH